MPSIAFIGSIIGWNYSSTDVLSDSKQDFTKIEKKRKRFNFVLE